MVACGGDASSAPAASRDVLLVRAGGDYQEAPALASLREPLTVRALDAVTLAPIEGLAIRFTIDQQRTPRGAQRAVLSDTLARTDRAGIARTELSLGDAPADSLIVHVTSARAPRTRFTVRVLPAPVIHAVVPPLVRSGDTVTVRGARLQLAAAPGGVRFAGRDARVLTVYDTAVRVIVPPCLPVGAVPVVISNGGARTAPAHVTHESRMVPVELAPFSGTVLRAEHLASCVTLRGAGARYLVVAQMQSPSLTPDALVVEVGAAGAPARGAVRRGAASASLVPPALAFERALRAREASVALRAPFSDASRGSRASARGVASAGAHTGALREFTVISKPDASAFATAVTRLAYAGERVHVWVDTASTAELSDSLIVPLARLFDTDLYTVTTDAFGETSDVDGDGRLHVVLTPIVNRLTPTDRCTASGFVGGYFSAHDLYAQAPSANGAEVVFGFVPDSLARFGCPHPVSEFSRVIRTTFVHELQHVINYQQHVLRRGGREEAVWLNEGLSHMAEELASRYYERRFPPPLGRGTPEQLFPDSSQNFILFNLINAYLFLRQPYGSSLTHFIDAGTLEERGAAWLFLRWLADQYGDDVIRRITQTSLTGAANIADKAREPFDRLLADFALAVYTDSLPGVARTTAPARWRYTSRNWRAIFQRLNVVVSFPPFPIDPIVVPFGGTVAIELRVGGLVFLDVTVPPDADATTIRFAPRGSGVWGAGVTPQVSIFRLP